MALKAALIITGIAIGLLIAYGADVAVSMGNEAKEGFLPLNDMQRGIGLGAPALILPIIGFFISLKEPSKGVGTMIIIAGILIIIDSARILTRSSSFSIPKLFLSTKLT